MNDGPLFVGAFLSGFTALAYALVGWTLLRRPVAQGEKLALRAFMLWWAGIGLATATTTVQTVLWLSGVRDPDVYATIAYVQLAPLIVALWGLFFYLGYLFLGRRSIFWPSIALYAMVYAVLLHLIVLLGPVGAEAVGWHAQVTYARPVTTPIGAGVLGLVVLPILFAAVAYGSLIFRLEDPLARYRVAIISLAILLWFGGPLGAGIAGLGSAPNWKIANDILTLAATIAILVAYHPPPWIVRRLTPPAGVV